MAELIETIRDWRHRNLAALWITASCDPEDAAALLSLDWALTWSALPLDRRRQALSSMEGRYQLIRSRAELPPEGRSGGLRFLYDVSRGEGTSAAALVQTRRAAELENLVEGWAGVLVVAGDLPDELRDLLDAFAPAVEVYVVGSSAGAEATRDVRSLARSLRDAEPTPENRYTLDLKDAPDVQVDPALIEPLGHAWELLTRDTVTPHPIAQEDLDAFLSGDPSWRALAAGAATLRGRVCRGESGKIDPIQQLVRIVQEADRKEVVPNEALHRMRIFAETGSGCTTLLRQAALAIARAGYPVLMTRPLSRVLRPHDVARLIVHVQDTWAQARRGRGSGAGTLPFCLILDADVELAYRAESFVRALTGDLNRKIVVVTAHQRSRTEIDESHQTLKLYAKTSKDEILAIGRTLREFSARWGLAAIPTDGEWEEYYASFGRLRAQDPRSKGGLLDTPALFLIGLYPFVKARVRDERSLSKYLYSRWAAIEDVDQRRLVEILAAAAAYGVAVPLECLRDPDLLTAATRFGSKSAERAVDLFVEWAAFGGHTRNWALHIRHPALGILLIRSILPQEAQAPYSPLLPVLKRLVGTATDVWFAEQLAYRLGRHFDSDSPPFSLVSDTPVQEAARAILEAIPAAVAAESRVVCHHHARYYVHLLHACLPLISDPGASSVPAAALRETARNAMAEAERLMEIGRQANGRERISNLLTTLAAASVRIADVLRSEDRAAATDYHHKAIDLARAAIASDVANGHAVFTYIRNVHRLFDAVEVAELGADVALRLFVGAEDGIHTLFELKDSRLWRNIEEEDAELQIARLLEDHNALARRLKQSPLVKQLVLKTPGARAAIALREILGDQKLGDAFRNPAKVDALRALRVELSLTGSALDELYDLRYRLFVSDPVARFDFEARYALLDKMALASPEDYAPYLHDHAAVAFQLDQIERSEQLFGEIRKARARDPDLWMWHNERVFVRRVGGAIELREVVVRVVDPLEGWATYDSRVRVKVQPRQWGDLQAGEYRKVYLRFRLTGLQAVDRRLAVYDLGAMGVANGAEDTPA